MSNAGVSRRPNNNNMRSMNGRPTPNNMGRSSSGGAQRHKEELMNGVYKNARFTHGLTKLIGCSVEVQVKNGKHYEGVFKTFSPELEVVLECAHLLDINKRDITPAKDRIITQLIVNFNDIVLMRVVNADTSYGETAMSDSFTDTGISRTHMNGVVKEGELKQLERWDDGGAGVTDLDDNNTGGGWSPEAMFQKNEALGVKSSYDDNMEQYTTKLKESDSQEYRKRREEADRAARDIERNSASRRNTALENGDEIDEETKYSAVIRPSQQPNTHSKPPHSDSNGTAKQRYVPPHHRDHRGSSAGSSNSDTPFSQSARFTSQNTNRNTDRNKTSPQTTPQKPADMDKLKNFAKDFVLAKSEPAGDTKSPNRAQPQQKASPVSNKPPEKVIQSPKPTQATPPQTMSVSPNVKRPIPNTTAVISPAAEAKVVKAEVKPVASAPSPQNPNTGRAGAASAQPVATKTQAAPAESRPATTTVSDSKPAVVAATSKLNPDAKEFTLNPNAMEFQPKAPSAAPVPPQGATTHPAPAHPPQHVHYGPPNKNKTATVSVVEAKPGPTPAQAMGQPLINSNHPHQQFHPAPAGTAPYVMVPQNQRVQRHPSYTGSDGGGGSQQQAPHQQPQYVPQAVYMNPMMAPMVHQQGSSGMQQMTAMPPPNPQHNAHIQQQQAGASAQSHQQQQLQPPHSGPHNGGAHNNVTGQPGVMSHPNQPSNNQHVHHPNYPHPNPQGASAMQYVTYTVNPSGQQLQQGPPPQQPPLQPSPHNPSPSPGVAINNGGGPMVSSAYQHYPPPASQQFYPPSAAAAHMAAVSQAGAAGHPYHHPQGPQLIYMSQYPYIQPIPGHYHHNMQPQQYPAANFQQQPQ